MKIKRFEAHSMSEALRSIKKEFGPDAVILSAKTIKKTKRVFGGRGGGQVIVTAAIDRHPAIAAQSDEKAGRVQPGEHTNATAARLDDDHAPKRSILERFSPITRTGRHVLRTKFPEIQPEQDNDDHQKAAFEPTQKHQLHKKLTEQGLASQLAADLVEQAVALFSSNPACDQEVRVTLCQLINARKWVAADTERKGNSPRISVLLGPPGVGKTTVAAKLAAECTLQHQSTVLISMDNQRAAGTVEMERYAKLMDIPMYTAFDPGQTAKAIKASHRAKHVIVDTPGLGPQNQDELLELKARLELLGQADLYLLISAAASNRVMQRSIALYKPLGISMLMITQLDWSDIAGPWINAAVQADLPIAYTTGSPLVSEGMQPADASWLTDQLWHTEGEQDRVKDLVTVVSQRSPSDPHDQYVANSNSDIFHRSECRSVQRINARHVVMFKNETEALGLGYKPCRMCCSDLLASKPIDRLPHSTRAVNRYLAR